MLLGASPTMKSQRCFVLTEAAAMLPLIRRILTEVRSARSALSSTRRRLARFDLTKRERARLTQKEQAAQKTLTECLAEADKLGVLITPGVRCEALFPFEHQWIGPGADGKLRPAFFVYSDAKATITEWYFDGWPSDRRQVSSQWWQQFRRSRPARRPART